jgi:hypothetical protein
MSAAKAGSGRASRSYSTARSIAAELPGSEVVREVTSASRLGSWFATTLRSWPARSSGPVSRGARRRNMPIGESGATACSGATARTTGVPRAAA